jgi:predicted transcriptional regulator
MIDSLPRREREIFEILCGLGEGTAAAIRNAMANPPSDSAVRALLARLVSRGMIEHRAEGQTYVYAPVAQAETVAKSALQRLVQTFFNGSAASAATALLGMEPKLTAKDIETLQRAIEKAKREAK